MIEIGYSSHFRRVFRRRIKPDKTLSGKFLEKLRCFEQNPFDPRLKTHKLVGRRDSVWSFSVDYDCRIIFEFIEDGKVLLHDIGGHDEVY